MSINCTVIREGSSSALNCKRLASRLTKSAVYFGCVVTTVIPPTTSAFAQDKWSVVCNVSDDPLPIAKVFTTTFFLCGVVFLTLLYLACAVEQTALGAAFSRLLNRCTGALHRYRDGLLRAAAAISFALLWADGGLNLTPYDSANASWLPFIQLLKLNANITWLSVIQLLIPAYQLARVTLPAAGAGILVLGGYGAVTCGPFHMLDYPVFVGLGVFFLLSVVQTDKLLAFRFDLLRWSVALSLLWPSMEIFVYPAWVAPIATAHPELALGFDVDTVVTAAGIVEFGLAFALFWTPLVRRLAALALALLLAAATFDSGRVEGIGHVMIFAILLVVFADPGSRQPRCRPALAPLVSGATWLATVFLYTGAHAFNHGSRSAALIALAGGAAALGFIFFCVISRPPTTAQPPRRGLMGSPGNDHERLGASRASAATIWPDVGLGRQRWTRTARFLPDSTDRHRDRALGRAFSAQARTPNE
jgi:hypothetical protein